MKGRRIKGDLQNLVSPDRYTRIYWDVIGSVDPILHNQLRRLVVVSLLELTHVPARVAYPLPSVDD